MTVRHPDVRLTLEEGGYVGACSFSCRSGTRDTSRKPGPHSLKCDDWVGSLEVSAGGVGAAIVCVRLSPRFSLVAPSVRDPFYVGFVGNCRFLLGLLLLASRIFSLMGFGSLKSLPGSWCARWGRCTGNGWSLARGEVADGCKLPPTHLPPPSDERPDDGRSSSHLDGGAQGHE